MGGVLLPGDWANRSSQMSDPPGNGRWTGGILIHPGQGCFFQCNRKQFKLVPSICSTAMVISTLTEDGKVESSKPLDATKYFERAQQLNPDDWNYHRQDWSFEPGAGRKWLEKFQKTDKEYYPLDMKPDQKKKGG